MSGAPAAPASLPPDGLAGLDPAWSRLVDTVDGEGHARRWHVLDSHAPVGSDATGAGVEVVGTLLCVHGNPTWSYLFRGLVAAPPPGWRVVAIDQLDMGFSERTGTTRPLARRIDDLGRLTAALELEGPVVPVAHDWGGPVALGWAQAHRGQVAGVVLSNTAVHQPADAAAPRLIRAARLPGVLDNVTVRTTTFLRGALALTRPALPAQVRAGYLAPYATAERRAAIGAFVRDIPLEPDHPSMPALRAVADGLGTLAEVPVLLVWGPSDPVFSERYLDDLSARLPQADVHRVVGASHLLPEETDLAAAVTAWVVARVPTDAGGGTGDDTAGDDTAGDDTTGDDDDLDATTGVDPAQRLTLWAPILDPARAATDAVVEPGVDGRPPSRTSFGQLAHDVQALAVGLHLHGVRPGHRVACLVTPGRELATLLSACWRLGAVIVVADAGLGPRGLSRALKGAGADHLVGIDRALVGAAALRWPGRRIAAGDASAGLRRRTGAETSLDELIATGAAAMAAASADALLPAPPGPDADAAVVFTSGSTGPSKGVAYRHRQLEAQREALRATYRISDDDRLVAAFAPFALYGPALGITSMVPDMDVTAPSTLTAARLAEAVAAVDATLVFASPAALVNVASTADGIDPVHRPALDRVRLLLSAGAPVPARLLQRMGEVMPAAEPHTPYGMTEALPVADIDLATIEAVAEATGVGVGGGVCVGHPVPGVEVAISALDAEARPTGPLDTTPGITGEVCVRAAHVKDRYDRLAVTELASTRDAGWHRSGDVGHLDEDGRVWIEGRLAHLITTADGVVTPVAVEQAVEGIDHIRMAAAVGVGPPGTQQVVVVVATDPPAGRLQLAPLSLTDRVREVADVEVAAVLALPRLPVDIRHESKIDRAGLADLAAGFLAGRSARRGADVLAASPSTADTRGRS